MTDSKRFIQGKNQTDNGKGFYDAEDDMNIVVKAK